ncbi:hypothetical protein Sxan_76300 [Streptomyces xanthophaeus]|uniref:Uncharacterized protein n=1 Tax=Streptomyces xanthophaeus TaxID=67385 RepID=A0A919H8X1_9ACTN|nr:hypothetical protein Sxan_76300 [Streptomyces xanthophaeus]
MTQTPKGPASYFPSIEKKYGFPVSHWQDLIRSSPLTRHMELVSWLKTEHGWATVTPTPWSPTP